MDQGTTPTSCNTASGNFSGRPFKPPALTCRSHSHHPSKSPSISCIARANRKAPTHVKICRRSPARSFRLSRIKPSKFCTETKYHTAESRLVRRLRAPDQPARAQRAVREPRVDLAPHVAAERPVVVLQRGAVRRGRRTASARSIAIAQRADLHRAERVQDVRVVPLRPAVPAARVSARLEPPKMGSRSISCSRLIRSSARAPVHAAHAQVLGQDVLQRVAIFRRADDEGRVLRRVQELGGEGGRVLRRVASARVLRRVPVGPGGSILVRPRADDT